MAREYFLAYHSYLSAMEPLNYTERGRLFTALLTYSSTGELIELSGNERFIFPLMRAEIDRSSAAYQDICQRNHTNGQKGGRPKKSETETQTNPKNPSGFLKTQKSQCEGEGECEGKGEGECERTVERANSADKPRRARFEPPSVADAIAYCTSQGTTAQEAQRFVDYYTANGWRVGKNPMRDWKAAARNWIKNAGMYSNAPAASQHEAAMSGKRAGVRDVTRSASEAQAAGNWLQNATHRRPLIKPQGGDASDD